MSQSINAQALAATFAFGIVASLTVAPFYLCLRGQGLSIFRDRLRLVLITFVASSALWALIAFIATLMNPANPTGCQVAVIFVAFFDQAARCAMEQYLLWAINSGLKISPDTFAPQLVLVIRFFLGGVYVGFQRPQLEPVCQTTNEMNAVGIAVAATDAVVIALFVLRSFVIGLVKDVRECRPGARRSKALLLLIATLLIWTGASVPLFLGIESIDIIWRTVLPAGILSLLLGLVALFLSPLMLSRARASMIPQESSLPSEPCEISPHSRDASSSEQLTFRPVQFGGSKTGNMTQVTVERRQDFGNLEFRTKAADAGFANGQNEEALQAIPFNSRQPAVMVHGPATLDQAPTANAKNTNKLMKSIFQRGDPKVPRGKLSISNPILQQGSEAAAFDKIVTVDLATAARSEKERRDMALMRSPTLIAQRPAPQPPSITDEEVMRRTQSVKRKLVAQPEISVTLKPQVPESEIRLGESAATVTSTQLSPGVEQIRRRSPRHSPESLAPKSPRDEPGVFQQYRAFKAATSSRETPTQPPVATYLDINSTSPASKTDQSAKQKPDTLRPETASPPKSARTPPRVSHVAPLSQPYKQDGSPPRPTLPPSWPRTGSVRNTIRPSRAQTSQPRTDDEAYVAPRAAPQPPGQPKGIDRRGTLGLPANPKAQALKVTEKEGWTTQPTVMFMNSIAYDDPAIVQGIINGASDRALTKNDAHQSPENKTQSRTSVVHRPRPIPRQQDRDRQLWPAEQLPNGHRRSRSGGSIISRKSILRFEPNSPTQLPPLPPPPKSAGYYERPVPNDTRSMTFSEKMDVLYRTAPSRGGRDSIPEVPPLPDAYQAEKNNLTRSGDGFQHPQRSPSRRSESSTKSSVRTQNLLEYAEARTSPRPNLRLDASKFSVDSRVDSEKNASYYGGDVSVSRVSIAHSNRSGPSYDGDRRRSSPVIPLNHGRMSGHSERRSIEDDNTTNWGSINSPVIMQAQQVQVPLQTQISHSRSERNIRDIPFGQADDGKEVMTIMLDAPVEPDQDRTAFSRPKAPFGSPEDNWNRQVGGETSTFSARKETYVSKRMPPPAPLLLSLGKKSIVLPAAEPSPLESPHEALEMIQQQLRRFEEPNRQSVEGQDRNRIRLLETIEQEMGQQEIQWHEMQNNIGRDSLTTVESRRASRPFDQEAMASSVPSQRSSTTAEPRVVGQDSLEDVVSPSGRRFNVAMTLDSGSERAGVRQRNLAAVPLGQHASLRPPSFKTPSLIQMGSTTPPDTDDEQDEVGYHEVFTRPAASWSKLWQPKPQVAFQEVEVHLWVHLPRAESTLPEEDVQSSSMRPRPAARKAFEPLEIKSARLWSKDKNVTAQARLATGGLWQSKPIPSATKPTARPVTQRPPRKSKRFTVLPDILESPEPLSDSRGTLGIFQFPWGEKSDSAIVQAQPARAFRALPGTMSTGGPVGTRNAVAAASNKQKEASDFPASFFDDYDEEDDYSSMDDDDEVDEGFDETTLWEIASLLKYDGIPSRDSLFPHFPGGVAEDDVLEAPDTSERQAAVIIAQGNSDTTSGANVFHSAPRVATLWSKKQRPFSSRRQLGVAQPEQRTWDAYISRLSPSVRPQARESASAKIYSTSLWTLQPDCFNSSSDLLWSDPASGYSTKAGSETFTHQASGLLWVSPSPTASVCEVEGLFDPKQRRTDFRSTAAQPAAMNMPRKPRAAAESHEHLPTLASLWSKTLTPSPANSRSLWMAAMPEMPGLTVAPFPVSRRRQQHPASTNPGLWSGDRVPNSATKHFQTHTSSLPLWTPPAPPKIQNTKGLSAPTETSPSSWAASDEVAPFEARRKPRINNESLAALNSTELWKIENSVAFEHDWITIASVGPVSPSYASSSGHSSPVSETSSVKTDSTKASSITPSVQNGILGGAAQSSKQPVWWETSKKSSRLSVLLEHPEPKPQQAPTEAASVKFAPVTANGAQRAPFGSADWDAALEEAIHASRFGRKKASAGEWNAALQEAIQAGQRRMHKSAATPETSATLRDVAVQSSKLTTESSNPPQLWTKAIMAEPTLQEAASLWTCARPLDSARMPIFSSASASHDAETQRLRSKRAQAFIPKNRKAEIRAQIAAIEAGADPASVGLVNFYGQGLWNRFEGSERKKGFVRGAGRNWIDARAQQQRASRVVFRYWLPGSDESC